MQIRSMLPLLLLLSYLSCSERKTEPEQRLILGEVLTVESAGRYLFFEMNYKGSRVWVAANPQELHPGDWVQFATIETFKNFKSEQLGRTFDEIYFAPELQIERRSQAGSAVAARPADKSAVTSGQIAKAPGGYTIAELFARREELKGQTVSVAGKVVKFNPEIMGRNWLHIQDGSGAAGTNDLTITTDTATIAPVGTTVTITGKVSLNKDMGAGYLYPVLIEEAKVSAR